VTAETQIKT